MGGGTKVGLLPRRLPADSFSRGRLLRLSQRGAEVCHKHRARHLAVICDVAAAALVELAIAEAARAVAERSLAAAQVRVAAIQRKLQAESFDEPTRKSDEETTALLRCATRPGVVKVVG